MKQPLTPRQLQIYAYIRHHVLSAGIPPTIREIMAAIGIKSTNGVRAVIQVLVRKGWLLFPVKGAARGIRLMDDEWKHNAESLKLIEDALAFYVNNSKLNSREMDVAHDTGVSIRQELIYAKKAQTSLADRKIAGLQQPYGSGNGA